MDACGATAAQEIASIVSGMSGLADDFTTSRQWLAISAMKPLVVYCAQPPWATLAVDQQPLPPSACRDAMTDFMHSMGL